MTASEDTIERIEEAETWDERVARIRQVPQRHGTDAHAAIYAEVARRVYVPHLAPDFAYVHEEEFYDLAHFKAAYEVATSSTVDFAHVHVSDLSATILKDPRTLLVFRTITGLTKQEFARATELVAQTHDLAALTSNKVDGMERKGTIVSADQAHTAALTVDQIMNGALFGSPPFEYLRTKQNKPDTEMGWSTVHQFATGDVPYSTFLHQRHYGGAFRQLLDATSTRRGNLIEDAVEELFESNGIPFIRTGAHNQAEIEQRFEVTVRPAPDFVVFDTSDAVRGILECKGANDGGTARDKAMRFVGLREEANRLGGIPLLAVIGGLGWTRVGDTLGPVVRDCDGRVFTMATLHEMLAVQPFPQLVGLV